MENGVGINGTIMIRRLLNSQFQTDGGMVDTWFKCFRALILDDTFDGALGFSATSKGPGIGFIIATICAISLIAYGVITILIAHPADSHYL
ncbi:MAG: hypothetical protein QXK89_08680 [Candidatus Bathyarchaeia archaeon]|nr:hypothetical protein [Candidatus Bathyarchaeota archaeon]